MSLPSFPMTPVQEFSCQLFKSGFQNGYPPRHAFPYTLRLFPRPSAARLPYLINHTITTPDMLPILTVSFIAAGPRRFNVSRLVIIEGSPPFCAQFLPLPGYGACDSLQTRPRRLHFCPNLLGGDSPSMFTPPFSFFPNKGLFYFLAVWATMPPGSSKKVSCPPVSLFCLGRRQFVPIQAQLRGSSPFANPPCFLIRLPFRLDSELSPLAAERLLSFKETLLIRYHAIIGTPLPPRQCFFY